MSVEEHLAQFLKVFFVLFLFFLLSNNFFAHRSYFVDDNFFRSCDLNGFWFTLLLNSLNSLRSKNLLDGALNLTKLLDLLYVSRDKRILKRIG